MKREEMLDKILDVNYTFDIVVIGGGATGVGTALEAASRGYQTLLVEQSDFAKGTSSRSTKLVHGGVRYLQQGNISLVLEALKERGILLKNAPHLVHNLSFVVPNYDWWEGPFYGVGMKLYDLLAGKAGFGSSKILSKEKTIERLPTIETDGLNGGVIYYDGQFDDSRLVINIAQTAAERGAVMVNYMQAAKLIHKNDMVAGLLTIDQESGKEYEINAKVVINATGVFADQIRMLDDDTISPMISPSQGVHIVLDKSFLPGDSAIMVPHTDDGRVLFAIPWHDRIIVGTTDTPVNSLPIEPRPLPEELDFLLTHTARYLTKDPATSDVLSVFAGLRPLVSSGEAENTAAISRDHTVCISRSGLVTITGGKWTTYRKMAEDVVDQAAVIGQLESRPSVTEHLNIHASHHHPDIFGELKDYGSDAAAIKELLDDKAEYAEYLHDKLPIRKGEVIWAVQNEMARTVEDFLSRRRRALLLDARASIEMAEDVAAIMAKELNKNKMWKKDQVKAYQNLAEGYIIK
ncbi:MAG: glycerol-3-phosphate dehydrogenase/oxidase [Calditrichaceae bacterium]|nr:glycerol-3-phosphate dehydrogenase/oxidase [Calditrichaceae bacterium]